MVYKHNIMGLNISKCEHHISLDCLSPCMRHSRCQQVGHTQIPAKPLVSDTVGSGSPHRNVCTGDDRQKGLKVIWCVCACVHVTESQKDLFLFIPFLVVLFSLSLVFYSVASQQSWSIMFTLLTINFAFFFQIWLEFLLWVWRYNTKPQFLFALEDL